MKKLLATAAFVALCTSAQAAPTLDAKETNKVEVMTKDFFSRADTNSDNYVSKSEHTAFGDKMFTDADTNGDGKLSMDEVKAEKMKWIKDLHAQMGKSSTDTGMQSEKAGMMAKDVFKKADTDGDNFISKTEHSTFGDKMFSDADSNSDGKLSMDEVKAEKMKWIKEMKMEKTDDVHGNVNTKNSATK